MARVLQHSNTFLRDSPSDIETMPSKTLTLAKEVSSTPLPGTRPEFSEGKFILSRARTFHDENNVIFNTLSECLKRSIDSSRLALIDRTHGSDHRYTDIIEKVRTNQGICGPGLGANFIYNSVARKDQGFLIWEKGEAIVGILTYRYRRQSGGDVYIDGICMNKKRNYSGGSQLFKFFIDCLKSEFNKFCLSSVPNETVVKFYESKGFVKTGKIRDKLIEMVMRVGERSAEDITPTPTPTPTPSPPRLGLLSRLRKSRIGKFIKNATPFSRTAQEDNAGIISQSTKRKRKKRAQNKISRKKRAQNKSSRKKRAKNKSSRKKRAQNKSRGN